MTLGRGLLYIASAAALAFLARSLLIGPLPLHVALIGIVVYFAIVLLGVFVPQLEMFARVLWHGPRTRPHVALTFDDGPHPIHTPRVLDLLDRAGMKATFFVIGRKARAHPQCIEEIIKRGHTVGVHGFNHDRFMSLRSPSRIQDDLQEALRAVEVITQERPKLFRPPVGHVSPRTETAARELDLRLVAWSVRGFDGLAGAKPARVAARVIRKLRPGSIIMLHDAAEKGDLEPAGVAALPAILDGIDARQLQVVPLETFVRWRFEGDDVEPQGKDA